MKRNNLGFFICLLSALLSFDGFGQDNGHFNELFATWDDPDKLQPGVSVAVIENEEIVFSKSVGYANLEYQIPLDNNSVFDIASLAKQFTGFAIAKLITEGKIGLNDPASQYLPELKILDKGILIKHLVYHTSGLRDISGLFDLAYSGEHLTSEEALAIIKGQKELNFPAGTEDDYSNTNYVLLALIVERISGVTFREWCDTNLFAPLKMENSFVNDNPYEIIENRAVAYYTDNQNFSFQQNNGMALIGSSAVYSTIDDMAVWLQSLQNEAVFPEVFSLMKQKGKLDNGDEIEYGFGLGIGSIRNEAMIEHSGATPSGFRSAMALFPNQSLAIIVLTNWGDINPITDFGIKIINNYLPTSEEENKEPSNEEKAPINYSKYVGLFYSDELKILLELGLSNHKLTIKNTKSGEVALDNKSEEVFVPENGMASSLVFVFNDSNEVIGFLLNRGSSVRDLRFTKIDIGQ